MSASLYNTDSRPLAQKNLNPDRLTASVEGVAHSSHGTASPASRQSTGQVTDSGTGSGVDLHGFKKLDGDDVSNNHDRVPDSRLHATHNSGHDLSHGTNSPVGSVANNLNGLDHTKSRNGESSIAQEHHPAATLTGPRDDHGITHASTRDGLSSTNSTPHGTATQDKPSFGEKLGGKVDVLVGKVTNDPAKVAEGQDKQRVGTTA